METGQGSFSKNLAKVFDGGTQISKINTNMDKLYFSLGNSKLSAAIATFALPAGHACPFAGECLSKSDRFTGQITDGPDCRFRCFSATNEARATSVRNARWRNWELLKKAKTVQGMADLIQNSLPFGVQYVRIHVAGDFFSETYFKAWLNVALNNPAIIFYAYTKSLKYWVKYRQLIPSNFRLVASKGGKLDSLIERHNLPYAEVVFSTEEARRKGLEIDHDDSHAIKADKPFALLLHATQPVGTPAAEAWKVIMRTIGGYTKKRQRGEALPAKSVKILVS